jgi:hypothetical protein
MRRAIIQNVYCRTNVGLWVNRTELEQFKTGLCTLQMLVNF